MFVIRTHFLGTLKKALASEERMTVKRMNISVTTDENTTLEEIGTMVIDKDIIVTCFYTMMFISFRLTENPFLLIFLVGSNKIKIYAVRITNIPYIPLSTENACK